MNACYAMEKEELNDLDYIKGSQNLCIEEKKETDQAIVVSPNNPPRETLQEFQKKWGNFAFAHYHIIDQLVDKYKMFSKATSGILPSEILSLMSEFSLQLVNKEGFVYTFPRPTEIHKHILAISKAENFTPQTFQADYVGLLCEARHKSGPSTETVYKDFEYHAEKYQELNGTLEILKQEIKALEPMPDDETKVESLRQKTTKLGKLLKEIQGSKVQKITKSGIFCDAFLMENSVTSLGGGTGIPIFNYVLVTEDQSLETYQLKFNALCDFSGEKLVEIKNPYDVRPFVMHEFKKGHLRPDPLRMDSGGTHYIDNVIFYNGK